MQSLVPVTHDAALARVGVLVGNEVLCRGIEALLQTFPHIGTVRRCVDHTRVEALLTSESFDFLILTSFDADWLDTVRPLTTDSTRILVLVDETATGDLPRYAGMAVDGFLSQRDLTAATLQESLRRCAAGEFPMPPALTRALLAQSDWPAQRPRTRSLSLTGREVEALTLLVRGMSNKQIARRLSISSHGAKRLVASIMLKLDSPNRTTAVVNAIKAGLVDCH
jgi:two-component system nitrate/nitrite response regulator NarL